ncbi:MAG: sugar ABC transporter substrate-binding protein [Caldilineaceae bacterium]|nr:sugar ABC transporter substrate-binding protein [Caldilineaceae bacterium]
MTSTTLSRRRFLAFSGVAAGAAALAACAPPTAPAADADGMSAEPVTVSTAQVWEAAFQGHQQEFDTNFMEENPDIVLEPVYNTWSDHNQVVPTWAAADTLPDIVYVHGSRAFPWAFEGITVSLQSHVDADPDFNIAGVWEEALRLYRFEGEQHGIPYDHGPIILGYNKDIFDAAGVAYPTEDWTIDDLVETSIQLTNTDGDTKVWGWRGNMPNFGNGTNPNMLNTYGANLYNDEETAIELDTPEARVAVQIWVDLIHEHGAAPTPAESEAFEQNAWIAGNIGMSPFASWNTPTQYSFANYAWDVAPWPAGPAGQSCGSFGSGFSITKNSSDPAAAWRYLHSYLSKEGMEFMWGSSGRGSPARASAYQSWLDSEPASDNAHYFLHALENYAVTGRPYQTIAAPQLLDITGRYQTLLQSGEIDVDSAITGIVEEANAVFADAAERMS